MRRRPSWGQNFYEDKIASARRESLRAMLFREPWIVQRPVRRAMTASLQPFRDISLLLVGGTLVREMVRYAALWVTASVASDFCPSPNVGSLRD